MSGPTRRRVWLPLLALAVAAVACAVMTVRSIGLVEWAIVLGPLGLVLLVESARFIVRRFLAGYRRGR